MDKFCEQLTPAYKNKMYGMLKYLYIIWGVMACLTILSIIPLGVMFGALAVVFYFMKRNGYKEYEYVFTSGDVDIDLITEATKRKRLISFTMDDVIMIAPQGSDYLSGLPEGKKLIAYPKDTNEKIYVAVVSKSSVVTHIYFIPNEEFVSSCFKSNPKNVKKKDSMM